ncbi:MAG: GyrI-like domain-containing protein [Chitinophagales bacterium]
MSNIPSFKLIEKEAIHLIGMCMFGNFHEQNTIPELWQEFNPYLQDIPNRVNENQCFGLEIYSDSFMKTNKWHYMTAVEVSTLETIPLLTVAKTLPPSQYAVFTHKGTVQTIAQTFQYIYQTWLPNADYEIAAPFDFEFYDERFKGGGADSETDIYLPVRPKDFS